MNRSHEPSTGRGEASDRGGPHTLDELRAFFEACDERETGREPDWAEHREVIEESIRKGSGPT